MKQHLIWLILASWCGILSCSQNVLTDIAKKDTNEAVFYDAQTKINKHNYTAAIDLLETLDAVFLARPEVAIIRASAYSGRCGLDFVQFVDELDNFSNASNVFLPLMQMYPNATDSKIADCFESETILKSFGDSDTRTADQNVLMSFSSFTKVGTVLSRFADTDNDGTVDAGFDHCDTNLLPDDAVREVGTGIALAVTSLSNAGSGLADGVLTDINNFCQLNPLLNIFCTATVKTDFSANEVTVLRAIIGSSDQGVGSNSCAGDFLNCICP